MVGIGNTIPTHKRHYLQQSRYTICKFCPNRETEMNLLGGHNNMFEVSSDPEQDIFIKLTIPASERIAALEDLDRMNINSYSLFETDEGLCSSLFNRYSCLTNPGDIIISNFPIRTFPSHHNSVTLCEILLIDTIELSG